jgi:hypothetical protein
VAQAQAQAMVAAIVYGWGLMSVVCLVQSVRIDMKVM